MGLDPLEPKLVPKRQEVGKGKFRTKWPKRASLREEIEGRKIFWKKLS